MMMRVLGLAIVAWVFVFAACSSGDSGDASPVPEASSPTVVTNGADTGGITELEATYVDNILIILNGYSVLLDNILSLSTEASDDPSILLGETWFRDLVREQDRLNEIQTTMLSLEVPPRFQTSHDLLVRAFNEMDTSLDLFESGARDLDDPKIAEALEHLDEGTRLMTEATDAIIRVDR